MLLFGTSVADSMPREDVGVWANAEPHGYPADACMHLTPTSTRLEIEAAGIAEENTTPACLAIPQKAEVLLQ